MSRNDDDDDDEVRTIRVVFCAVGELPIVTEIDTSYETLSKLVGGMVEFAYVNEETALVANEEGAYTRPFNRLVPALAPPLMAGFEDAFVIASDPDLVPPGSGRAGVHRVHGDFFLCGRDLTSLTLTQAAVWIALLGEKNKENSNDA